MKTQALVLCLLAVAASCQSLDVEALDSPKVVEDVVYETATLTGFAGRSFQFNGEPGAHYVLVAGAEHQLSARFQRSESGDRVTTFIDAMGLVYRNRTIVVAMNGTESLTVALDGEPLRGPTPEEQVSEYALESEDPAAALTIAWQATSTTSAVFLRTEMLAVMLFVAPGEPGDSGEPAQPAFLNFDIALLVEPAGGLQGIIGETYERLMAGDEARTPGHPLYEDDDDRFHGNMADYVVAGFAAPLARQPGPVLGDERDGAVTSRRRLASTAAFPLAAAGRTRAARAAARKPAHAYRRLLS